MTNNKQQTAVEWQHIELLRIIFKYATNKITPRDLQEQTKYIFEQAKEMVKEQRSIELPSDEEIDEKAFQVPYDNTKSFYDLQFIKGAKWMRDKIRGNE